METNLCVAGFGGQGVMTLGKFLASATCDSTDKNVTFFPSYGAEQRGGTANCFVVISDEMVGAPLGDVMDDLIVMNGPSLQKFLPTLKQGGTLFINSSIVPEEDIDRTDIKVVKAPVTEMALEMGNAKVLNVIMLGVYVRYGSVAFFRTAIPESYNTGSNAGQMRSVMENCFYEKFMFRLEKTMGIRTE